MNISNRLKQWWKDQSTPYSEHTIDYLKERRKKKTNVMWFLLILDFILFILVFIGLFSYVNAIDYLYDVTMNFWTVAVLLGIVIIIVIIAVMNIRIHNDFLAMNQDHDMCDLFIYLKRNNNEFEMEKLGGEKKDE